MLDRGFAPDVERILARTTPDRQTALFSATVPDWVHADGEQASARPGDGRDRPRRRGGRRRDRARRLRGRRRRQDAASCETLLDQRGDGSVIVFGRTKHGVKKLGRALAAAWAIRSAALQGNLSQNARDRVMADFRAGQVPILLRPTSPRAGSTSPTSSRSSTIELPESPELFTHRIGRTGRMGRQGQAITLLGPRMPPSGGSWSAGSPVPSDVPLGAVRRRCWLMPTATVTRGSHRRLPNRWQPLPQPRSAKRHGLPRDAPRPRAGKQRHDVPTTRGPLAVRVKSPPIRARAGRSRAGAPLWPRSAPPGLGGRRAWRRILHRVTRRWHWSAAAPERRARRRHQSVCATVARPQRRPSVPIRRGRSTVTAATTRCARPAARRWPHRRFSGHSPCHAEKCVARYD